MRYFIKPYGPKSWIVGRKRFGFNQYISFLSENFEYYYAGGDSPIRRSDIEGAVNLLEKTVFKNGYQKYIELRNNKLTKNRTDKTIAIPPNPLNKEMIKLEK